MANKPIPQPPLDQETEDALRAREYQPTGRQAAGDASSTGNTDDDSGSGGTANGRPTTGKNVASGTHYDKPGNADEGDVGGSTTSSGTGVSGSETGQVNL